MAAVGTLAARAAAHTASRTPTFVLPAAVAGLSGRPSRRCLAAAAALTGRKSGRRRAPVTEPRSAHHLQNVVLDSPVRPALSTSGSMWDNMSTPPPSVQRL